MNHVTGRPGPVTSRAAIIAVSLSALLCSMNGRAQETTEGTQASTYVYRIAGGSRSGSFTAFISSLGEALPELEIEAFYTGGGGENLEILRNGRDGIRFALVQNDLAYSAYYGRPYEQLPGDERSDEQNAYERNDAFRAVLPLFTNYQQVYVRPDSQIEEFRDLNDKRIAMGEEGSASYINARHVLNSGGIRHQPVPMSPGSALRILRNCNGEVCIEQPNVDTDLCGPDFNGCIDAVFVTGGWRNQDDLRLAESCTEDDCEPGRTQILVTCVDETCTAEEVRNELVCVDGVCEPGGKSLVLRRLPVPAGVLAPLFDEYSYYEESTAPTDANGNPLGTDSRAEPVLSTTTYLLVNADVPAAVVSPLVDALVSNWPALSDIRETRTGFSDLVDLRQAVLKDPFPFHAAADSVLIDYGYRAARWNGWLWAGIAIVAFAAFVSIRRSSLPYDRLGRIDKLRQSGSALLGELRPDVIELWLVSLRERCADFLFGGRFLSRSAWLLARVIVVLILLLLFVVGALWVIQFFENPLARDANEANEFLARTYWEQLIWMFTWMATGFEDELYPTSPGGKVAGALFGLAGLAAPLVLLYKFIAGRHSRAQRRERGESAAALRLLHDHVLICGWNDKVPGLIYSLTGRDAPRKLRLVVIAEMEEEFPLRRYRFDSRYVHYCRGDSADYKSLALANARHASKAIIVAGDKKLRTKNASSALTGLALKKANPDILLVGEMVHEANIESIHMSDAGAIVVNGPLLGEQLIALASRNPMIVDFVLDMLTYDDHSECSSRRVSTICSSLGVSIEGLSAGELCQTLRSFGLNMLCARPANPPEAGVGGNDPGKAWNCLLSPNETAMSLRADDEIVFVCDNVKDLEGLSGQQTLPSAHAQQSELCVFDHTALSGRVLIVGDAHRASRIASLLGAEPETYDVIEPSTQTVDNEGDENCRCAIEDRLRNTHYECAIFLNSASGLTAIDHDTSFLGDAEVIMRCQLAKSLANSEAKDTPTKIIGEINHLRNQILLSQIGITAVVPIGMLVQRFLSKPMFDRGYVTGLLLALTDGNEGAHLRSIELTEDHELVGTSFAEAMGTTYADGRVIACIPKSLEDDLRNEAGDFGTHFVATLAGGDETIILNRGDIVVGISKGMHSKGMQ